MNDTYPDNNSVVCIPLIYSYHFSFPIIVWIRIKPIEQDTDDSEVDDILFVV